MALKDQVGPRRGEYQEQLRAPSLPIPARSPNRSVTSQTTELGPAAREIVVFGGGRLRFARFGLRDLPDGGGTSGIAVLPRTNAASVAPESYPDGSVARLTPT